MKEIESYYVQNPDGTWSKVNPSIMDKIIYWIKEMVSLIKD